MKKNILNIKKIANIFFLILMMLIIASCGGNKNKEITFTYENMEITLPDNFKEEEMESYNKIYANDEVAIYVIREKKEDNKKLKELKVDEYFELVKAANSQEEAKTKKLEDIPIFTYDSNNPKAKEKYSYYISCHESEDAFWIIQFACSKDDFNDLEKSFDKWIRSINFK